VKLIRLTDLRFVDADVGLGGGGGAAAAAAGGLGGGGDRSLVIHLVRDPRAIVNSRARTREFTPKSADDLEVRTRTPPSHREARGSSVVVSFDARRGRAEAHGEEAARAPPRACGDVCVAIACARRGADERARSAVAPSPTRCGALRIGRSEHSDGKESRVERRTPGGCTAAAAA